MLVAKSQASEASRRIQELHDALQAITTNGQAVAAADLVIGALTQGRDQFSDWSLDYSRRDAYSRLDEALQDVIRYRQPLNGNFDQAVQKTDDGKPAGAWDDLYHAIQRGYGQLWAVQSVQGNESEAAATIGYLKDLAVGTVQAMPGVISAALHFTSELASDTVGGVAKGILPLWPIVVIGGLILVAGSFALAAGRKRGLVA